MSQDGDGLHADGYDRPGPPPELRDPPRRSRAVGAFLATFALAAFAGVVWYAYDRGLHAGSEATAPLIQADPSPIKVRPEQPGGLDVPNQDKLVYGALRPGQAEDSSVERLLPPPEKPVEPPAPPPAPAATESQPAQDSGAPADGTASATVPIPARTPQAAPTTAQEGTGQAPAPVTSQTVPAPEPAPQQQAQAETSPPPPVQPQAGDIPPARAPEPPATETQTAAAVPPPAPAPEPKPEPKPEPAVQPAPAPKPAATEGRFRVQLGAFRDEAAARGEWNRLTKRYPSVLGGLSLRIQQVDLGAGKGVFHRIQGGMLTEDAAERACATLKAQNQACLLVRP
jgi:hypothetical protein